METPINNYLQILAADDGSDLYLSTGAPPCGKFQGEMKPLSETAYKPGEIEAIAQLIMDEEQREQFLHELEMNLAISISGVGRFRINIFKQRNETSIVARNINTDIPKFEDLGLPEVLKDVVMEKRGLVLFVGGTGSGKSTSLAALIDYRNTNSAGHIITIEDPVEYVHRHKKSLINQREVGVDTRSFKNALKNTLRQAPDVILIGEIRDRETMEHALEFAETGHLAISTLHANNANQALERIINLFPEERRPQLLLALFTEHASHRLATFDPDPGWQALRRRRGAAWHQDDSGYDSERTFGRHQRDHGEIGESRYADLRFRSFQTARRRPHQTGGCNRKCGLGKQPPASNQAL